MVDQDAVGWLIRNDEPTRPTSTCKQRTNTGDQTVRSDLTDDNAKTTGRGDGARDHTYAPVSEVWVVREGGLGPGQHGGQVDPRAEAEHGRDVAAEVRLLEQPPRQVHQLHGESQIDGTLDIAICNHVLQTQKSANREPFRNLLTEKSANREPFCRLTAATMPLDRPSSHG